MKFGGFGMDVGYSVAGRESAMVRHGDAALNKAPV